MPPTVKSLLHAPQRWAKAIEWGAAILGTLAGVWLLTVYLWHAKGLWRDEAGLVQLATLPTLSETWRYLGHESCPLFYPLLVRAWSALGAGGSDFGLRVCGWLAGLLILGAAWLNGRVLTRSVPLLSLGLLAANAVVVASGSSLRAYGMGSALMLLTLAAVWVYVKSPGWRKWIIAAATAVLSVQCLFQNAFLLLAVCLAGSATRFRAGDIKGAFAALALGVPAALSLLPYISTIRAWLDWSVLSQTGFLPEFARRTLVSALSVAAHWLKWAWVGLILAALARWVSVSLRGPSSLDGDRSAPAFFAGASMLAGAVLFYVYVRMMALPTQVWYYLPLIAFSAVCIDAVLADWQPRLRWWQAASLCLMIAVPFPQALRLVKIRRTSIDLAAAYLRDKAGPEDLIVVLPWHYGISFGRYWNDAVPWITIPPLKDHRVHR